jgi:predicted nucleic acid-binding protein
MRLYLDTSVFSAYYDERAPERMEQTRKFWIELNQHEKLCSTLTLEEIARASDAKAQKMRGLATDFRILQIDEEARGLAQSYVQHDVVPTKYFVDALHIAVAVLGEADILVSWNFDHMVKRGTRLLVNYVNSTKGLRNIEILAPPEI